MFNVDKGKITNLGLTQQEEVKNSKHGPFYAPIGFAFLPFVMSFFGSFCQMATCFLFALANLQLLRYDESSQRQGLVPLVYPSAGSQYCALCYSHITAQFGNAVTKFNVMSLLALPRLLLPPPMDSSSLKWNCPGPADSFLLSSQFPQLPCTLSFSFFLYLVIFLSLPPSPPLFFPLSFHPSVSSERSCPSKKDSISIRFW